MVIVEPAYRGNDRAHVNAGLVDARPFPFPDRTIRFASTPEYVTFALAQKLRPRVSAETLDIEVGKAGGIRLERFTAQRRTIEVAMRGLSTPKLALLSGGPEAFFAAALLPLRRMTTSIFMVLRGKPRQIPASRSIDLRYPFFGRTSFCGWGEVFACG